MVRVALVGNPNVGKSTIFNALTGLSQHVGNWPGKTVEVSWADIEIGGNRVRIVDLPGSYSILQPGDEAEEVVKEYLETNPDVVVVVADASCLKHSLYPLVQVLEMGKRAVLVVNMMDEARKMGMKIDLDGLSKELGIPVVGTVASSGEGIEEVKKAIIEAMRMKPKKLPRMKAEERHRFIEKVVSKHVREGKKREESIDRYLFTPIVDVFLIISTLLLLFVPTFSIAPLVSDLLSKAIELLGNNIIVIILDALLSFIPLIFTFFFMFSFLEDSGLLARVAASLDRYLPIPGKAFFPVLLSFGCNVVGVPATRIIRNSRYKKGVIMGIPFVPCSTRISVLLFFLLSFPHQIAALLAIAITLAMLAVVLFSIWLFSGFEHKEPLIIELPPLRFPSFKNTIKIAYIRTKHFIWRIGLWVILGALLGEFLNGLNLMGKKEKIVASLVLGFFAKELTLGAMTSLFGTANLLEIFSFAGAVAFLFFYAFYTPCMATVGAIREEIGKKYAVLSVLWSTFIALFISILAYLAITFA